MYVFFKDMKFGRKTTFARRMGFLQSYENPKNFSLSEIIIQLFIYSEKTSSISTAKKKIKPF